MLAVWITIGLFILAIATAFVLGWRRFARAAAPVEAEICGPTCYPRVERGGHQP